MRMYRIQQKSRMKKSKTANLVEMTKVISTSIRCDQCMMPQWTSDAQLNYMTQYDFISYSLEEDRMDLIEKPFNHQVIAARFAYLIGHHAVRIVYLYKNAKTNVFHFMIIPSYNVMENFSIKTIMHEEHKIENILNFVYLCDLQAVIMPVLYENQHWGIIYLSLAQSKTYTYLSHSPISIFEKQQQFFSDQEQFEFISNAKMKFLKQITIHSTKQPNLFVVVTESTMKLMRISTLSHRIQLVSELHLHEKMTDFFSVTLSKTFIFSRSHRSINVFSIEDEKIAKCQCFTTDILEKIRGMTGASNRIIVWLEDRPIIYQYRINEITQKIDYVNSINLELNNFNQISDIIISDSAHNAAIITSNHELQNRQSVANFFVFKLELYTELGIAESSLYIRNLKYSNRNKRVNRLVIPKIYQRIYALTGSEVHSLDLHRLMGVLSFDIHPLGLFMVVSYSFNIKIYSLEHRSMTLLYSLSMHNIKKVQYSSDGSHIVLFSSRRMKILDAYSFQLKQQFNEKSHIIVDVCFGSKKCDFYILMDNGTVVHRNFLEMDLAIVYRFFGQTNKKINELRIDEGNSNLYIILEDGTFICKNVAMLTAPEISYEYEDKQKVSTILMDEKNALVFIGTKSGILRVHQKNPEFRIEEYNEKQVTNSEITAMVCSSLQNLIYVGNQYGDITMLRYDSHISNNYLAKSSKILNSVAPKIMAYFSFDFELISLAKFQGSSEQNALQDKLQNLIQKIQQHTNNFRQSVIEQYSQNQKTYMSQSFQNRSLYRDYDCKGKKARNQILSIKQKYQKNRLALTDEYEDQIKKLFRIQIELTQKKKQIEDKMNKQLMDKRSEYRNIERNYEDQLMRSEDEINFYIKKENFVHNLEDEEDFFKISELNGFKLLNKSLTEELSVLKNKCLELNKNYGYLETAKKNMLARKILEETLEFRIQQELNLLSDVKQQQKNRQNNIGKDLKSTEDLIHRIQNKVKNTPNNVISSDKADSDLCSYKIWMKNKVQGEVQKLSQYLANVNESIDKKSQQMVEAQSKRTRNMQKIMDDKSRLLELKSKLKKVTDRLSLIKVHNEEKGKNVTFQALEEQKQNIEQQAEYDKTKVRKIASMERINQRAIYFENKNLKIHLRKVNNLSCNNSQLLKEYEKLKYENKELIDRQQNCRKEIRKMNEIIEEEKKMILLRGAQSERSSIHLDYQTPFLKYVRNRSIKTRNGMKKLLQTATVMGRNSLKTSRIH